ncbi:MAG: hypothetical protein LBV80_00635 [Deltaproteobacteria bacterium]|jgi:hypothetical protein|nr:hypothetical protein [Deltaproteobacteria bacterium]
MIQVVKNGLGPWAEYSEAGTTVSITCHNVTLPIDCAARQTDARVTIDVVHGAGGALVEGIEGGGSYVATLEIPPAKYAEPDLPVMPLSAPDGEDGGFDGMAMEGGGSPERLPLTPEEMATVILRLWTIPVPCLVQEGAI